MHPQRVLLALPPHHLPYTDHVCYRGAPFSEIVARERVETKSAKTGSASEAADVDGSCTVFMKRATVTCSVVDDFFRNVSTIRTIGEVLRTSRSKRGGS